MKHQEERLDFECAVSMPAGYGERSSGHGKEDAAIAEKASNHPRVAGIAWTRKLDFAIFRGVVAEGEQHPTKQPRFARGLAIGLLLVLPFWLLVIAVVYWGVGE